MDRPAARRLDLKGITRGSSMRLLLDGAEVWRGLTFLGIVSADWLAQAIQERLEHIATTEWLKADLTAPADRALGPPPDPPTRALPLRKPLAHCPITRENKAARRVERRRRGTRNPR